jgi:hypothetical protein
MKRELRRRDPLIYTGRKARRKETTRKTKT